MLRMRLFLNVITGEAGWTPDQWGHSRFRTLNTATDSATNQKHLTAFMRSLLKASPKILLFSLSFSSCFEISFRHWFLSQRQPVMKLPEIFNGHHMLLQNEQNTARIVLPWHGCNGNACGWNCPDWNFDILKLRICVCLDAYVWSWFVLLC